MARFCPKCGGGLPENARFCGGCGAQFDVPQPAQQQQQPFMQQQQPAMQPQYQQPYTPAPAPPPAPAKKKSKALPIVIIALLLVVALFVGIGVAVRNRVKTAEQQIAEGLSSLFGEEGGLFGEEGFGGLFGEEGGEFVIPEGNEPGDPGDYDPGSLEEALSQFNSTFSATWPENEFTKQVPKPKFETGLGFSDDTSFGILTSASVAELKAYVSDLKRAGFTKNASTTDESVFGLTVYTFEASNSKGYKVEVTYSMGMSAISIKKG